MAAPRKHALLIGINYVDRHPYEVENHLGGCVNDVAHFKRMLVGELGYGRVTTLADVALPGTSESSWSLDESASVDSAQAPTRANILAAIDRAVARTRAGDTLFVLYSGHGSRTADLSGTESDSYDETIVPLDSLRPAGWGGAVGEIHDDELWARLVAALPAGVRLRALFDSCHSGSVLDLPNRLADTSGSSWSSSSAAGSDPGAPDVLLISGCRDDQTSADDTIGGQRRGALSYFFQKHVRAVGAGGSLTWGTLVKRIREDLAAADYDQVPQVEFTDAVRLTQAVDI